MGKKLLIGLILSCSVASVAYGLPLKPLSPLDTLETLNGRVDLEGKDHTVTILLTGAESAADRSFRVELSAQTTPPRSFFADPAQILFWRGHLVVIVPGEHKALHFSIPGFAPASKFATGSEDVDGLLSARYDFTRIDTATAIISRNDLQIEPTDPEVLSRGDWEKTIPPLTPPPNPGVGNGSCGTSCTQACADGSSCSVTCGPNRCAHCSCPISCSCS